MNRPYFENESITLYHGDCRDILPELEEEDFELALTDPPYLVSQTGRFDSGRDPIHGDDEPSWVQPAYAGIWRVLKRDALCISFYGWPHAEMFLATWKQIGFRPVSLLVLIKERWGLGQFTRAQHEEAYLLAKGHPQKPDYAISDVLGWEYKNPPLLHPHQKPLGVVSKMIATFSGPEAKVLDPFCGSGTTLLAARNLGRRAVGVEIEERFCEIAAKRFAQQTFEFRGPLPPADQLLLIEQIEGKDTNNDPRSDS